MTPETQGCRLLTGAGGNRFRRACRGLALVALLLFPIPALGAERVRLQLKWQHQFQFAGYYAAQAQGYYREAGIEVEIAPAGPGEDAAQQVLQGRAEFGVGSSELLLLREKGAPVVVLAAVFQHSPLALMALKTSALQSIHDLAGREVMVEPGSAELYAYLRSEGLSPDKVVLLPHKFQVDDLLSGKVAAMSVYVTDEPFDLKAAGREYLLYSPRAVGIDFYGDNLFTTEAVIEEKPELVKKFLGASLRGWDYAMRHQEETARLISDRYSQRHSLEHLLFEAGQMVPLLQMSLVEVGHMNPGRWRNIAEVYAGLGMLKRDFDLKGFLYDPNPPPPDLTWLYYALAAAASLSCVSILVAARFARLSAALRRNTAVRRRIEEALKVAKEEAEAANRAKGEFLANMSHELRTPMNAIVGMTHLALRTGLNEKQRGYLTKIDAAAQALTGIIDDILDFSRIEAGKLEFEHAAFSLDSLLANLAGVVGLKAEQKGVDLVFSVAPGTPRHLVGDALRLGQILVNLAGNAVKFTERGEVAVAVAPEDVSEKKVRMRFSVRDTGIGMPPDQVERLFRPFTQGDASISRRYGGTGLGLAISRELAGLMGGRIEVASEPGRGSTFTFTVELDIASPGGSPAAEPSAPKLGHPSSEGKAGPGVTPPRRSGVEGCRVLLVEDNAINRDLVVELLAGLGVSVEVAENGREGVARATAEPFDLVLMDVQMPEMDGLTAARMIRAEARLRGLPIVAMTAHAMSGDREKSLEAGMDDHVTKPLDPEKLEEVLCRWIAEGTPPRGTGARPGFQSTGILPAQPVVTKMASRQDEGAPEGLPSHLPPFDIPRALSRVGGNRQLLSRLVKIFREMYAGAVPDLRGLVAEKKYEEARLLAHSLKGAAGALEAADVSSAAAALEMVVRGGVAEEIETVVDTLDRAMAPALAAAASMEDAGPAPAPDGTFPGRVPNGPR